MKTSKPLNPVLNKELVALGSCLRQLRKKRQFSLADVCERIGVNPRTVSKVEKGDPTVSLGTFIEYLNLLDLSRGLTNRIVGDYLLLISDPQSKRRFTDDEMNF
jgi:transcriptional regulator with XRE-family HTH domain